MVAVALQQFIGVAYLRENSSSTVLSFNISDSDFRALDPKLSKLISTFLMLLPRLFSVNFFKN